MQDTYVTKQKRKTNLIQNCASKFRKTKEITFRMPLKPIYKRKTRSLYLMECEKNKMNKLLAKQTIKMRTKTKTE